jgi:hypothetical protein
MSDLTINAGLVERIFGRKINWSKTGWTAAEGAIPRWRVVEDLGGLAVVDEGGDVIASFHMDTASNVDLEAAARLLVAAPKLLQLCKLAAERTDDEEFRAQLLAAVKDGV